MINYSYILVDSKFTLVKDNATEISRVVPSVNNLTFGYLSDSISSHKS